MASKALLELAGPVEVSRLQWRFANLANRVIGGVGLVRWGKYFFSRATGLELKAAVNYWFSNGDYSENDFDFGRTLVVKYWFCGINCSENDPGFECKWLRDIGFSTTIVRRATLILGLSR